MKTAAANGCKIWPTSTKTKRSGLQGCDLSDFNQKSFFLFAKDKCMLAGFALWSFHACKLLLFAPASFALIVQFFWFFYQPWVLSWHFPMFPILFVLFHIICSDTSQKKLNNVSLVWWEFYRFNSFYRVNLLMLTSFVKCIWKVFILFLFLESSIS